MSEQTGDITATDNTNEQSGSAPAAPKDFKAITSQEDFDAAIQSRIARERAKVSDYEEAKAAQAELAALKDAQKSDEERRAENDAERDRELATLRAEKLRAEVAAEKADPAKGIVIPAELLAGTTREELEASADALIAFRGEGQPTRPRVIVTTEGDRQQHAGLNDADRDFVGQLFQKTD